MLEKTRFQPEDLIKPWNRHIKSFRKCLQSPVDDKHK